MMAEAGISLSEGKANLVDSRASQSVSACSACAVSAITAPWSRGPTAQDERQAMIAALTTNVTRFFREPHHFEHLKPPGSAWAD